MEKICYKLPAKAEKLFQELSDSEMDAMMWYIYAGRCCMKLGYKEAAKHFITEALDEFNHQQKLADFTNMRGLELDVSETTEPKIGAKDLKEIVEAALKMEIELAEKYNEAIIEIQNVDVMAGEMLMGMMTIQKEAIDGLNNMYTAMNANEDQYEFQKFYYNSMPTPETTV